MKTHFFVVCYTWHTSSWWKSNHGYLPPGVVNHKSIAVML